MKFNTGIAAMMALVNEFYDKGALSRGDLHTLILLLNPVAPHITEEIRELQGFGTKCLYEQKWPEFDPAALVKDEIELPIQVNGKVKGKIMVPTNASKEDIEALVKESDTVKEILADKELRKLIVVPGRIINMVVG